MNNEIFITVSINQISLVVYNLEEKKEIYKKFYKLNNTLSKNNKLQENLNNILNEQIINIEKIINSSINNINFILDDLNNFTIKVSTKKNYDNKQIKKSEIEYIIQDLKQQILINNKDIKILHIIIDNYLVDGKFTETVPLHKKCDNLVVEANFICSKKDFIIFLEKVFKKYQINLKSITCARYASSLLVSDEQNLINGGLRVISGINLNEVHISPKKPTKLGFFEKIFHFFN